MWLWRSAFGNFRTIRRERANGLPDPTTYLGFGGALLRFINSRGRPLDGTLYFDVELATKKLSEVSTLARAADVMGVGAVCANEIRHDPFVRRALAPANFAGVRLGTAMAMGFPRGACTW